MGTIRDSTDSPYQKPKEPEEKRPLKLKLSIYPRYPMMVNDRFKQWHPETASMKPGEVVLFTYLSNTEPKPLSDRFSGVTCPGGNFPLPLRLLLGAREGDSRFTEIYGQPFELIIDQEHSKNPHRFEEFLSIICRRMAIYGEPLKSNRFNVRFYSKLMDRIDELAQRQLSTENMWRLGLLASSPCREMSNQALKERFERISTLGCGGQGIVYEVKEKGSGQLYALKISTTNVDAIKPIIVLINELLNQEKTPHLTRVYELFDHPVKKKTSFESILNGCEAPNFFHDQDLDTEREEDDARYNSGFLMERLDGDMESLPQDLSPIEKASHVIQIQHALIALQQHFNITTADVKARNILVKKIGPEDTWRGKKLLDYDYLRYHIGGQAFTIPRGQYLLKLADYDCWSQKYFWHDPEPMNNEKQLQHLTTALAQGGVENGLALFNAPLDPSAKVLDIDEP